MFKTVKRRSATGEICQINEETKQKLIDERIVRIGYESFGENAQKFIFFFI